MVKKIKIINNKNGLITIHSLKDFEMLKSMLPEYCTYEYIKC